MEKSETVLVTGGTGFVGSQTVLQLLHKGYKVKTTIRAVKNQDKVIETLKANGIISFDNLSFVEVEFTKDYN